MMSIEDMHYDFRLKMNMVDENNYYEFSIPEIDWLLNEAYEYSVRSLLFKTRVQPLTDTTQRVLDDFSTVIKEHTYSEPGKIINIPENYMYFVRGRANVKINGCKNTILCVVIPRSHQRMADLSTLDKSDPMWGEINLFNRENLFIFEDLKDDWKIEYLRIAYIMRHPYMHYAEGMELGNYIKPDGVQLTGKQDCILKREVCRDIVDIAVLLGSQGLSSVPDINIKLQKLKQKIE